MTKQCQGFSLFPPLDVDRKFQKMSEDERDLRLRRREGCGGARARTPQPNQNQENGEHLEGGDTGVKQDPSQQVASEGQCHAFIDRDKYMLVAMAMVAFNIMWFLCGWLLANILFVVASINFWRSIRSVAMIDIFFAFLIYTFESSLSNAL